MSAKTASSISDILSLLSDGRIHTMQEIADKIEVYRSIVKRHIQSLSYCHPIVTFKGGDRKGGVYLEKHEESNNQHFTSSELQLAIKIFNSVQRCEFSKDEQLDLDSLLRTLASKLKEKEIL